MLEIIAYTSGILGVIASIIEILQFFKILGTKHKVLIIILISVATIICFSSWYIIDKKRENKKIEELKISFIKTDASSIYNSIIITGYETAGDFLSYLIQITGFYGRHKELYGFEFDNNKKEVENWSSIINNKKAKGEPLNYWDYGELKGLVISGQDHMRQISK